MGGDLELVRVKKNHVSGQQSGSDSSMSGDSDSELFEELRRRLSKRCLPLGWKVELSRRSKSLGLRSDHEIIDGTIRVVFGGQSTIISFERRLAKIALKFYEKRIDAKFKVLEVLFSNRAVIAIPGFGFHRLWCHVSFIAKPRNADCSDDSPKHFFGEMVYNLAANRYDVNFCSIFEPSDPGNIDGCVFCPPDKICVHPAYGCPAGGREIDKLTAQIQMDASQGQIRGCLNHHPVRPSLFYADDKGKKNYIERLKSLRRGYAEIALEFYKKSKGVEFEIVEVVSEARKPVVVRKSNKIEKWCHVCFTAKPSLNNERNKTAKRRKVDCSVDSPQHFFGELLLDRNTRKYNATYCEIFKPHRMTHAIGKHPPGNQCSGGGPFCEPEITHGCVICPSCRIHPTGGFRVSRPSYTVPEFPNFVVV